MATTNELIEKANAQVAQINETAGANLPQLTPLSPITPGDLNNEVTPAEPVPSPVQTNNFQDQVAQPQAQKAGLAEQQQQQTEQYGTAATQTFEDYITATLETPGFEQVTAEQYAKEGVDKLQAQVNEYDLQIMSEQTRLRREIERIQKGGGLKSGAASEIRNAERDSIAKQADLGMLRAFAFNDYQAAKTTADRAVNAITEQNEKYVNALKENYNRYQDLFTTAQQREFQVKLSDYQRQQEFEISQFETLQNTKLNAMQMAQTNGAPQSVLDAISNAKTPQEVLQVGGQYASVDMLDRMYKQAQIASIYDSMNARAEASRKAAQEAATKQEAQKKEMEANTEQALGIQALASELMNADGLSAAVGWGFRKSVIGSLPLTEGEAYAGSSRADFEATAKRLANMLTLDNLDLMSGVLSETDIKILESAGSNLGNFNMSERQYKKEIQRVYDVATRAINENGLSEEQAAFWGIIDETDSNEIDLIFNN